jgi:KaiC/GvpD/RAD55 family RecA-like ATPase
MTIKFSSLKKGQIILFITSETKYSYVNNEILKNYVNKEEDYCVYITVNKAYATLIKELKAKKIDTSKFLIIDAITPVSSGTRVGNAIFIGSPRALTNISLTLTSALKKVPEGKRLLFLDSISTLLVYNNLGTVSKFSNFIINKMREWKVTGAIISLEKEKAEGITKYLSQIVDRVIEVK